MFAPKIAKPQMKATESSTSKLAPSQSALVGHRLGHDPVEQALFLRRKIGNQATLRLLARRGLSLTGSEPRSLDEQEADPASGTTPGISWDFSMIPVFPPEGASRDQPTPLAAAPLLGALQPGGAPGELMAIADPLPGSTSTGASSQSTQPQAQLTTPRGRATSIDVITSASKNALSSFPVMPDPECQLNSPGPVNNTTTGSCNNINQILFNLAGIDSSDVWLLRIVQRTTILAGKQETIEKSDGPSAPTIARPGSRLIGVADCPGFKATSRNAAAFPISYHAHFILGAFDALNNSALAKVSYDVAIDKQTIDDPSPANSLTVTDMQMF